MEVAGLVLGALSIAIVAVEKYPKGLELIKCYKNYPETLRGIRRNLLVQEHQLQITLESIGLSKPTLKDVQQRLREIKPDCYDEFLDILKHMDNLTLHLMDKLEIDANGKPNWAYETPERALWEWRKIKRSFGYTKRKELFDELQHWNAALKNCLEPKREIPSDHADPMTLDLIRYFDLKSCDETRDNARILYEALAAAWSNCNIHQHQSNVELIWQQEGLKETGQLQLSVPAFRKNGKGEHWQKVFISINPKRIPELGLLRPHLKSSKPLVISREQTASLQLKSIRSSQNGAPDSQLITGLCDLIQQEDWNGHLLHTDAANEKVIYMKRVLSPCSRYSSLSLETVISVPGCSGSKGKQVASVCLSRKERLGVAAAAVWAVLMLCGTPWLKERWLKKEDIILLVEASAQGKGFDKTYPSLSYTFTSQQETSSKPAESHCSDQHCQIPHKELFELGVLLIELGLNKPFHQLHVDANTGGAKHETSLQDDYSIAKRVINNRYLELDLGESYANAVQRCIQCHFLGPEPTHNFLHSDFRKQFFTGVVAPVQATFDAQITSVR